LAINQKIVAKSECERPSQTIHLGQEVMRGVQFQAVEQEKLPYRRSVLLSLR
jgi:hypothetical protein